VFALPSMHQKSCKRAHTNLFNTGMRISQHAFCHLAQTHDMQVAAAIGRGSPVCLSQAIDNTHVQNRGLEFGQALQAFKLAYGTAVCRSSVWKKFMAGALRWVCLINRIVRSV
jgi:uncharacterized protein YfiM (DUF2279 family)